MNLTLTEKQVQALVFILDAALKHSGCAAIDPVNSIMEAMKDAQIKLNVQKP